MDILVSIDYFTKCAETVSYSALKAKYVTRFIENNIICWYGVPHDVISDNAMHFEDEIHKIFRKYKIEHHKSFPYRT